MSFKAEGGKWVRHDAPEKPTLKRLHSLYGEPPWTYQLPMPDALPEEAVELIGAVEMGGAVFERKETCEMVRTHDRDGEPCYCCSRCGGFVEDYWTHCQLCGAEVVE